MYLYLYFSTELVTGALCKLDCLPTEVYAKFSKQNGDSFAYEEIYVIKDGDTILKTSPTFEDKELRVMEYCLPFTTHNQYTVELKDTYGDSWTIKSWLRIEGIYGNIVFKNYLNQKSLDVYPVSLYMPITKLSNWMLKSSSVSGTWKEYDYVTTGWSEVTLGSVTTEVTGTQYFRKTFTGIAEMAAYELRMNYRYGVVAYINGFEIYRDNMPDGEVVSTTAAMGFYETIEYHGVIRPGKETTPMHSILAVELHWTGNYTQTTVDFDAFLAMMAPSALDTKCFIYGDGVGISSTSGTNPQNAFDFNKGNYYYASVITPISITFNFLGSTPYINGLRFFTSTSPESQPKSFTWSGSNSVESSSNWKTVITATNVVHTSSSYTVVNGYFNSGLFKKYKTVISETSSTTLNLYEIQPMICSIGVPTDISFAQPLYSFYAKYGAVKIRPIVEEFTGCTVANLPAGLTIDNATCTVSGTVMTVIPATSYTMTTTRSGVTYNGVFSLEIIECAGTLVQLLRTYQGSSFKESFSIKDTTTSSVVYSILESTSQTSRQDWTTVLCLTGSKYTVTTDCIDPYWSSKSFLYIKAILSGSDMETIARIKHDINLSLPTTININVKYLITSANLWHYKMATVPVSWIDSSVAGWESAVIGNIPASTNQLQFYKKVFDVSSVTGITGYVLSLRYKYGCVVYLNGIEAFRNGVTGDITTTTTATNHYSDVMFRQISRPIISIATATTPKANYLHQGSNTIAIGLVAISSTQTDVVFDCALRLMSEETESRAFDFTVTSSNILGDATQFLNPHYSNYFYYSSCSPNYFNVVFNNDRREWISSVEFQLYYTQDTQHVRQFDVLARNSVDENWTSITNVTNLSWSLKGQNKKIWIGNSMAFNQYRFQNFASGTNTCNWKFGRMDIISDDLDVVVPPLSYTLSTIVIYENIEMGEVYASSAYYSGFTSNPILPDGISLDTSTGMISGTCKMVHPATNYVITAKKFTGEVVTVTISLEVSICFGGVNLITLVARTDSWPSESSYRLYEGKGTTGKIVSQIEKFPIKAALNYGDFCIKHGIYTLELRDTKKDGWSNPAGYYLTVDLGTMIFEMGQVASGTEMPTLVTTMFSSYLPFQINFDTWKVWSSTTAVDSAWKDVSYDDKDWREVKAAEIGKTEAVTVYIRKAINIPSIDDYQILNVRMRYIGGIAVYFNGHIVARFNLPGTFDASTSGLKVHDATEFSKFHAILGTAGYVEGINVISFEVHRPAGETSAIPVEFDATGVFGVNDCNILVDTYSHLNGSSVMSTSIEGLMDLNPVTYGYQPNVVGTFIEWTVENLQGSIFNKFGMQAAFTRESFGFSVYGRQVIDGEEIDEYTPMFAILEAEVKALSRASWSVPVGMASYRQIRYEIDETAGSAISVSSYMVLYCKVSGIFCPAVEGYPAVANGQISPGLCARGFRGYSFRLCKEGVLGVIDNQYCMYKKPGNLAYLSPKYTFVMGTEIKMDIPTFDNLITDFTVDENVYFPDGMMLDRQLGVIKGIPTETFKLTQYTIYGSNKSGTTSTSIWISVRKGECNVESVFPKTTVNEIAIYDCALQGSYVGKQKRWCVLGKEDGEWKKATGVCIPIYLIVILIVVAIIIIVAIIMFFVRSNKKARPVGGIKAKKTVSSVSKKSSKKDKKSIKV